jgi:hypothetical protein
MYFTRINVFARCTTDFLLKGNIVTINSEKFSNTIMTSPTFMLVGNSQMRLLPRNEEMHCKIIRVVYLDGACSDQENYNMRKFNSVNQIVYEIEQIPIFSYRES